MRVLIVAAFKPEVEDLLLCRGRDSYLWDFPFYERVAASSTRREPDVTADLIITGWGKVNAASAVTLALFQVTRQYQLVWNVGFCGAMWPGAVIGTAVQIKAAFQSDVQVPGLHPGQFTAEEHTLKRLEYSSVVETEALNIFPEGMLSGTSHTADSFYEGEKNSRRLDVADMETASIASVTSRFKVNMMATRVVSDSGSIKDMELHQKAIGTKICKLIKRSIKNPKFKHSIK